MTYHTSVKLPKLGLFQDVIICPSKDLCAIHVHSKCECPGLDKDLGQISSIRLTCVDEMNLFRAGKIFTMKLLAEADLTLVKIQSSSQDHSGHKSYNENLQEILIIYIENWDLDMDQVW